MEGKTGSSNFEQLLAETEEQFKAQFDPNNPQHHKGDNRPVPIGGARVPEQMKEMYPKDLNDVNKYIDPPVQEINYGPEYDQITQLRADLLSFKKSIAKISQILEAILRHKESFKAKGDPTNEAHKAKLDENLKKETDLLAATLIEVQPLAKIVLSSEFKERYDGLNEILEHAKTDFNNKEDLTDFGFNLKKYSANSFTDAGKLMDKLKKIKKEYAASHPSKAE